MHPRIAAARELVKRALQEELKRSSVLSSPAAVRDYIRLLLIGKEYEVFIVLFLGAQNRVTATYKAPVKCQAAHNLPQSGRFGPLTRKVMENVLQ